MISISRDRLIKFVKLFPNGDMMDRAIFFVAINAFEKGRFKQALRVIKLDTALSGQEIITGIWGVQNTGQAVSDKLKRREELHSMSWRSSIR